MKMIRSFLATVTCMSLLAVAVGCQPPVDDADVDTSTDLTTDAPADPVDPVAPSDSNVTTGAETPDSNITTGAETPGSNVTTGAETPGSNVTTGAETPDGNVTTGAETPEGN